MALLSSAERRLLESFSELVYGNPFLPGRIEAERRILGRAFIADEPVWSQSTDFEASRPNLAALNERAQSLLDTLRKRRRDISPDQGEATLYVDLGIYVLYYRVSDELRALAEAELAAPEEERPSLPRRVWEQFKAGYLDLFAQGGGSICPHAPGQLLALCFQTRRAFVHVFNGLLGGSDAAARLRAEVWHSIFTHDRRRYARVLYNRMRDLPTLITGESGTGKEIVAGSIARSQYRPFDDKSGQFAPPGEFAPLNLSAMPSTLIESELFGHTRGSFTGATADRRGWLETVGPGGCVFLDEVGDIAAESQVKLLRVLQDRTFQRIGDTRARRFEGKIIAATNHDLAADMAAGRFRHDLYYRLSGDLLRTPTLREQVAGNEAELVRLLSFVARRVVGPDPSAREGLVSETLEAIGQQLGPDYSWPGNFRELEQCVRNVLVRKRYAPPQSSDPASRSGDDLPAAVAAGSLTTGELLRRYVSLVHRRLGTYEAAARHLGIDRRTVKAHVEATDGKGAGH
jgi:transcriptional regulator with AAA-type ATPase domain